MMRPQLRVKAVNNVVSTLKFAQKPVILRQKALNKIYAQNLTVASRWFDQNAAGMKSLDDGYWRRYAEHTVQMELTQPVEPQFQRFDAPLGLFLQWQQKRLSAESSDQAHTGTGTSLYIAQHALESLPEGLRRDIPTPLLVANSDLYGSSLWLGIPPTYTPLHRDPNDNLFVQLCGKKKFRFLSPEDGASVLGNRKIRLEEELMSESIKEIETWLWDAKKMVNDTNQEFGMVCFEAEVGEKEGLFIPRGWWHSVRSSGIGINASANWWFR